jgi:hypothetical protein
VKLVCIQSPWAELGGGKEAALYLQRCIQDCLRREEIPLNANAIYYILNGTEPEDETARARRLSTSLRYVLVANIVAVYCDHGISQGMKRAIDFAYAHQRIVIARRIGK